MNVLCIETVAAGQYSAHLAHFQLMGRVRGLTGARRTDWFFTCIISGH
jgi:hypothetical protein